MPTMTYELQDGATPVTVSLYKQITTLGRSPDNDICIPDPLLDEAFAQIHFDGQRFTLSTTSRKLSFSVNGRQRKQTQLKHNDQILAGSSKFIFRMFAEPREQQQSFEPLEAYRKIYTFSKLLMQDLPMEELLYGLLDQIVEVTQAERGFLIMLDEGKPHVVASRNINKESLANPEELYSDSIVAQVATQKKPLIVSDALQDTRYNQSQSVLDLQLSSVMCVPMLEKGALLGVIYVGNSRVRALFDRQALEVLTIFASQASMIVQKAMTMEGLQLKNKTLLEALQSRRESEILGTCDAIREVLRKIHKVATTDISVLVTGETGTGKELVARELHRLSPRHGKPFVTINCGAIPENLLESELFGHVRGAFTGAIRDKIGKFQAADGGTLFLDELGEMPINLQVKLLRALEEKKIIRVGSHAPEDVDIRIVAATNRKLEEEVEAGRFREDLYYRLNVINIHL
ncbi:MAG: sigma 54-interacting transcriptional regulator, partial [Myxococcota bacterium]